MEGCPSVSKAHLQNIIHLLPTFTTFPEMDKQSSSGIMVKKTQGLPLPGT